MQNDFKRMESLAKSVDSLKVYTGDFQWIIKVLAIPGYILIFIFLCYIPIRYKTFKYYLKGFLQGKKLRIIDNYYEMVE